MADYNFMLNADRGNRSLFVREIARLEATLEGLGAPCTEAERKHREALVERIDSLYNRLYDVDRARWRDRNWNAPPRIDAYQKAG